jgi:hypothetical protein
MAKSGSNEGQTASARIDKLIADLGDWRAETLSKMRKLVKEADPDVLEEVKWAKATSPGHTHVVARRNHLHRRGVQVRREAHVRERCVVEGPGQALQLEPRGQHTSRDRHP